MNTWYLAFRDGFENLHFKENTQYTLSFKGMVTSGSPRFQFEYEDGTYSTVTVNSSTMDSYTLVSTAGKTVKKLITTYGSGSAQTLSLTQIILVEGVIAQIYVPHAEQNILFPLQEGQKLMQGEELKDNGKENIWSEYTITGEESGWELFNNKCVRIVMNDVAGVSTDEIGDILCTHLIKNSQNNIQTGLVDYGISTRTATTRGICIRNKNCSTLQEYINWFNSQYNADTPLKIQYKKGNPTITSYTPAQQTAYNQIKKLRTYKEVTHISSTDETPATIELEYYQDVNTWVAKVNDLEERVLALESQ